MQNLLRLSKLGGLLVLAVLVTAGCSPPESKTQGKATSPEEKGHEHPEAPHGGLIVEWGSSGKEEFHAEVVIDRTKKKVTVYVLDDKVKDAVPIDAKEIVLNLKAPVAQIKLKAEPQEKDKEGKSSRFSAVDDRFGKAEKLRGEVSGFIGTKQYAGDFDEAKVGAGH